MAKTFNQLLKQYGVSKADNQQRTEPRTFEELRKEAGKLSFSGIKKDLETKIGFETFGTDISSMGNTLEEMYGGWQSPETITNTLSSMDSMRTRIDAYQEYRRLFGKGTDMPDLSELSSAYGSASTDIGKLADHYAQFSNKNEYDALTTLYSFSSSDIDAIRKGQFDKVSVKGTSTDPRPYYSLKNRDVINYIGDVAYTTSDGQNITWDDLYDTKYRTEYEDIYKNKPDFNEKSVYIKKPVEYVYVYSPGYTDPDTGIVIQPPSSYYIPKDAAFDEHLYNYINKDDEAEGNQGLIDISQYGFNPDSVKSEMFDEEIKIYNYLVHTEGFEKANEYLKLLEDSLKQRELAKKLQAASQNATEHPISSSLYSIITNAESGIEWAVDSMAYLVTGDMDYNTNAAVTSTIRGTVSNNYDWDIGGWDAFDFVYNVGMNMADSAVARATGGGAISLSFSAAAHATNDALDRGLDNNMAFLSGVSSGVFEGLFESVSIGNFKALKKMPVDSVKTLVKNVGKSMLVNASEETLTEIANILYDDIVNGDFSQAETQIRAYMSAGMSEEEAKHKVAVEKGLRIAEAGVSGAFMGLGFGGYGGVKAYHRTSSIGKGIKANDRASDIFDIASNPEVGSAYETYTQYSKKDINAENAKNAQVGRLYTEAYTDASDTLAKEKPKNATPEERKAIARERQGAIQTLRKLKVAGKPTSTAAKEAKKIFNVGEETKVTKTGETFDTKSIKVEGDKITIATEKGKVSIDDVTLSERDAELAYVAKEIAKENGEDIANLFLEQYDGKTNVEAYQNSFNMVMEYAKGDFTFEEMMKHKGSLSATEVSKIYEETVLKTYKEQQSKIEKLIQDTAEQKFYKGSIDESAITNKVWKKLDTRQRKAITFVKGLAKATGMNLVLTHNPDSKTGGSFNKTTNTITIDVAKFKDSMGVLKETIIPTMSHEMTHWMEQKSPELYRKLSDLVFSALQEADGMSESTRLALEYENQKAKGREYSSKELRSEIVARACEDILSMSEQGQKLFDSLSESEKQTLGAKIKEILHNLMDMIQKMLGAYKSNTDEARALQKYQDKLQEIAKIWDEMLLKSVEANQALEKSGVFENKTNADGDVLYALREEARKEIEQAISNKNYDKEIKLTDSSPAILTSQKSVKNLPMMIKSSHARENILTEEEAKELGLSVRSDTHFHGLGKDLFLKVIDGLDGVKRAYRGTKNAEKRERRENYFLLISQYTNDDGDIINVPIYINQGGMYNEVYTPNNKIATVFGKKELETYLQREIKKGNLVRIKNRSIQASESSPPIGDNYSKNASKDRVPHPTKNVKEKFSDRDSAYMEAVKNGDMETAQRMVDEVAKANGYTIKAYHGTSRADRVGNVFLPERATSGPMAFFTDNKEIAEGYSKSKRDTSMAYDPDYDSYETQFRIKTKAGDTPLYRAWGYLPFDARNRITKKAQQLREDWDGDGGFILDPDNKEANGGFQWQLKEARGNTLLALIEQWLNSGNLFNEENRFLEVLEMSGVMEEFKKIGLDSIYFKDPNARHEKVYDTYLRITNPFDTSLADNSFVDELISWYEEQDESLYSRESMESDLWDKNSIDAYEFADRVRSDIERGTFHAWTSIPDSVTDYLKSLGYDGIKDLGGKNSDVGNTVWIPFSSEQVKSAEPVTYDDKGNVIPLSQRFNKENNDIRYSDRDNVSVYDIMGERDRILKENEQFRKEIENLKERVELEKKVTNGTVLNNNSLLAAAAHLRNIANSNMDKVELAKALKEVYSFILTSKELTWDELFSRCYGVAEQMYAEMKPTVEVNEFYKSILADIKKTKVSFNESQKMEARHAFDKNWNRYFFGRITISDSGIPLESMWADWSQQYPDIFRADINDGDMVRELYDVLGSLQSASETVMEYNEEETKRYWAQEIYNQFWNVSTIKTTADKYDKQIKLLKSKHRNYIAEVRESYKSRMDEKLKAQHKADKEKANELYKNLRERKDKEIALAKEHGKERLQKYKDNAERMTRIQRITANVLSLKDMLEKNSKDKHVPEILKGPVISLIQSIDFSSKRLLEKGEATKRDYAFAKALGKVKDMMVKASNAHDELIELYGHGLDDDIEIMVSNVDLLMELVDGNEFVLNRMSNIDLRTLENVIKTIKHAVNHLNEFHILQHNKGAVNLAGEFVEHGQKIGNIKKQHGTAGKFLKFRNRTPYYFFKDLGPVGEKLFLAFRKGWDKLAFNAKKVIDYAEETYTTKEVQEWSKETKQFTIAQPDGSERTFEMSIAQIMALHCVSKQNDARTHLFSGGMTLKRIDKKGHVISDYENISLSVTDLQNILDTLTDRQKEVADKLQKFMNTVCSDWGNEISMARFGIKMFGIPDYFPIKVSEATVPTDNTKDIDNASLFRLLNMSFTKSRVTDASQSIEIGDVFDIFAQHSSDMAKYNALALPVLDFNKFYSIKGKDSNGKEYGVVQTLKSVFGDEANGYIRRFVRDLNSSQNVSRDVIGNTFFKNAKVASVAANLRVVLLQPTAYLKASAVMDNKYLLKAKAYIKVEPIGMFKKLKKAISLAEKYCGIVQWKSLGYYDTDISKGITEKIKHADSIKDKVIEKAMKGAELADKTTFGTLWVACEFEIRDTRKDLKVGSEEYYKAIADRLSDVIYATQVVDSTMTRSDMMRSLDGRDKMLTTFGSEPTIAYNMLLDVVTQTQRDFQEFGAKEAFKKNGNKIRKVVTAYVITNAMAALVESAFDALRDDDDEEMDVEKFLKLYFKNFGFDMSIGNKLPYIKELYSIMQGYSSSRMDTQWATYLFKVYDGFSKLFEGKGDWKKTIKNTIKGMSDLIGLPFYNLFRDAISILEKLNLIDW